LQAFFVRSVRVGQHFFYALNSSAKHHTYSSARIEPNSPETKL